MENQIKDQQINSQYFSPSTKTGDLKKQPENSLGRSTLEFIKNTYTDINEGMTKNQNNLMQLRSFNELTQKPKPKIAKMLEKQSTIDFEESNPVLQTPYRRGIRHRTTLIQTSVGVAERSKNPAFIFEDNPKAAIFERLRSLNEKKSINMKIMEERTQDEFLMEMNKDLVESIKGLATNHENAVNNPVSKNSHFADYVKKRTDNQSWKYEDS